IPCHLRNYIRYRFHAVSDLFSRLFHFIFKEAQGAEETLKLALPASKGSRKPFSLFFTEHSCCELPDHRDKPIKDREEPSDQHLRQVANGIPHRIHDAALLGYSLRELREEVPKEPAAVSTAEEVPEDSAFLESRNSELPKPLGHSCKPSSPDIRGDDRFPRRKEGRNLIRPSNPWEDSAPLESQKARELLPARFDYIKPFLPELDSCLDRAADPVCTLFNPLPQLPECLKSPGPGCLCGAVDPLPRRD